jgi:hypothetical protein
MQINASKEWCEKMARREEGDPTTGDPLAFEVRRSVRSADGKVQIVAIFPTGSPSLLLEVIDGEFDSDAVADRIVALWNAQP